MNLISQALKDKYISFDDEEKYVIYTTPHQTKKRNFKDPEEKVQLDTFLKLIYIYGYDPAQIKLFEPVTMGSATKEADIVVYQDDKCTRPHIVVECKKNDISEMEFSQAVNQAQSYAQALAGTIKYIWVTSGIKDAYYIVDKESTLLQTIPDIPRSGVTEVQKFKYAKGGRLPDETPGNDPIKQKYFELTQINEDELTRRFKQAHNALWAGGELNPSEAFDELDKLIFCKIWDERKPRKSGEPYDFQIFNIPIPKGANEKKKKEIEARIANELFDRINALYAEGKKKDPEVFKDNIRLSPAKVKTVVSYLEGVNLSKTDLDSKGKAFETFMGSYFRGDFGQFFTPRNIVKFVVSTLPIQNDSKVLDTSCGSGGFLLYALDKIRHEAGEYYAEDSIEHYRYWHDFAEKKLFGIEINEQIARTAKMNMIIHDDGHTNVVAADGLLSDKNIREKTGNQEFKYNSFDFIITNPPFGSIVKQTEKAYLHQYNFGHKDVSWLDTKNSSVKDRANQSTEVLFIEQAYNYLKEGGFLAIVIPDGVLTNSSLQYVRDQIEEWYRIVAVVSMPQTAFAHTGAGVKSSVLFLRKLSKKRSEKIANTKKSIQERIKKEQDYIANVEALEKEKKRIIKAHEGFENALGMTDKKAIEQTEAFKVWKKEISELYNQKINDLKDEMNDLYLEAKKKELDDYPIFMAIAEDIGYDATGKPTGKNELEAIGRELKRFIEQIIENEEV